MVSKNEGMKLVVNALLNAIPPLFNIFLITLFFFIIFAILGVQLFMGAFHSCNDQSISLKSECNGIFKGEEGNIIDREWINSEYNFDNTASALMLLFEVSTLSNWPSIMFSAVDSTDAGI